MADAPPQPPAPPSKEQQLSIEEQQIIAEIQELQRHLSANSKPKKVMTTMTRSSSCRPQKRGRREEFSSWRDYLLEQKGRTHGKVDLRHGSRWLSDGVARHRDGRRICVGGVARC